MVLSIRHDMHWHFNQNRKSYSIPLYIFKICFSSHKQFVLWIIDFLENNDVSKRSYGFSALLSKHA